MNSFTLEDFEKLRPIAKAKEAGIELIYSTPNRVCKWRVQTLFDKEPDTINWLRRLTSNDVLLDVGANVGMYSIFAALAQKSKVIAFEPESQNFAQLCKNIELNKLHNQIIPFCAGLSDETGLSRLHLSQFLWDGGSSCHSLNEEVGFDLKPRHSDFVQGVVSYEIDKAVKEGMMPIPQFIKIDVDGFEHKVIEGALLTLKKPEVRSLCIEVNGNLEEHKKMLSKLEKLGFYHDPLQVERSIRKEGAFVGCAEYILDRVNSRKIEIINPMKYPATAKSINKSARVAFGEIIKKAESSRVETDPFPYIFIEDLFPTSYYEDLLEYFPSNNQMSDLAKSSRVYGNYTEPTRMVTAFNNKDFDRFQAKQRIFWDDFSKLLSSREFIQGIIDKFKPWCSNRLATLLDADGSIQLRSDALIVSDRTNYSIGPHTDLPHRLITFLFYLPKDDNLKTFGTSIYRHKNTQFECAGGPHYKLKCFNEVARIPFLPNSLLMFVRNNRSFHGVEPIAQEGVKRNLLINNLMLVQTKENMLKQGWKVHEKENILKPPRLE